MQEKTAEDLDLDSFEGKYPKDHLTKERFTRKHDSPAPEDANNGQDTLHPRYPDDYAFAQELVKGTREAWNNHFRKWKTKSATYIERRYPGIFNGEDKENILQDMEVRLLKNNMKYLREYRGMHRLSTHIQQQLEWAALTELRKKASDVLSSEENRDVEDDSIAEHDDQAESPRRKASPGEKTFLSLENLETPRSILTLPDKQRWVFLLRYYDDFGFPENEISLLAKNRGVSRDTISRLIDTLLESMGDNVLARKRADIAATNNKIQKYLATLYTLSLQKQKLETGGPILEKKDALQKIKEVEKRIDKVRNRMANAIAQKKKSVVETPFEIIATIVGEENLSTIRGHLFQARKYLVKTLYTDKKQISKTKRPSR